MIPVLVCATFAAAVSHAQDAPILRIEAGSHTARVQQVAFMPGGAEMVSVGWDKAIRIWDVSSGRQQIVLHCQIGPEWQGRLMAAAVSPAVNHPLLAVGGFDQPSGQPGNQPAAIRVFNWKTGEMLRTLTGHTGPIRSLSFSPDGSELVSGSNDGTVRLWDPATGSSSARFNQGGTVRTVCFAPDGSRIAACSDDGTVRIWNKNSSDRGTTLPCRGWTGAWSSDGGMLAIGDRDGSIHLYIPSKPRDPGAVLHQEDDVTCLAFTPDGRWLVSGGGTQLSDPVKIHRWSMPGGEEDSTFYRNLNPTTVLAAAFSADGKWGASGDGDGSIYLWEPTTGRVRHRMSPGPCPSAIAWSSDSSQVAWSEASPFKPVSDRALHYTFNLKQGAVGPDVDPGAGQGAAWKRPSSSTGEESLRIPGDDPRNLSADPRKVLLYGGSAVRRTFTLSEPGDQAHCANFGPGGQTLVIGSEFALRLYDTGTGRLLRTFVGHDGIVWDAAVSPDGAYLASASADHTVRIWSLSPQAADAAGSVHPLLTIYRARNGQWVAATAEGYYNSSPIGDELIGWQVNRGPDRAADFYPADQFRQVYFRPDVLSRLLPARTVAAALQQANAQRGPVPAVLPPTIDILSPAAGSAVSGANVEVRARITDPQAGSGIHAFATVNGRQGRGIELPAKAIELPAKSISGSEWTETVDLIPGQNNTITLEAVSQSGQSSHRTINVYCQAQAQAKPALYVLAVGVDRYDNPGIQDLASAVRDATAFANAWRSQQGALFRLVDAKTVTQNQATRSGVLAGLDWLADTAKPGDRVILFLSGHGVSFPEGAGQQWCFAPYGFDLKHPLETGVSAVELDSRLAKLPGLQILVLDTCHSALASPASYEAVLRSNHENGIITLASCLPGEESYEGSGQHGLFTQALLSALTSPDADENGDGTVTLAEAEAYISNQVQEASDNKQHPSIDQSTGVESSLPLAILGGTPE